MIPSTFFIALFAAHWIVSRAALAMPFGNGNYFWDRLHRNLTYCDLSWFVDLAFLAGALVSFLFLRNRIAKHALVLLIALRTGLVIYSDFRFQEITRGEKYALWSEVFVPFLLINFTLTGLFLSGIYSAFLHHTDYRQKRADAP